MTISGAWTLSGWTCLHTSGAEIIGQYICEKSEGKTINKQVGLDQEWPEQETIAYIYSSSTMLLNL